ncbi:MAG: FemAB family PEP-CTERM system-associated protein [Syntrophotaleaceae bacterium]
MEIRLATEADQIAWDDYVDRHPQGLAYHCYAWRQAVEQAYRHEGFYLLAETPSGLVGVLPLIDFRVPGKGGRLVSLPFCDVGGVLADNAQIGRALLDAAAGLARQLGSRLLDIRFGVSTVAADEPQETAAAKVRMVMDLPENSEQLLAGFKAKVRSQVKKPIRDGLVAQIGGGELVEDFYRIFCQNMRDLGSPVHSRAWIRSVVAAYGKRARVGLVHAPDGTPAAAGILLLHPRTVSIPWASALSRFNRFNPNMLLYWTLLSFAADNDFARFDFGRSTPGEGTYRFKAQWGAQPEPLDWRTFDADGRPQPQADGRGKGGLRRQVEALWRHLPLTVANVLGPVVRRRVSL